jgi:hypothetical protein
MNKCEVIGKILCYMVAVILGTSKNKKYIKESSKKDVMRIKLWNILDRNLSTEPSKLGYVHNRNVSLLKHRIKISEILYTKLQRKLT